MKKMMTLSACVVAASLAGFTVAHAQDSSMTQNNTEVRDTLAPHSLMVQSSLESALVEVKGLRSQIKAVPASSPEAYKHIRLYGQQISNDVKTASVHEGEIQGAIQKFPQVASSSDYKDLNSAVSDVKKLDQSWRAKFDNKSYWSNKDTVMNDLATLENKLNNAIDKTKDFSSNQVNVSLG